ncbi:MAG TPA: hypothetical protein VL793_00100 [Patescibacteria group bacterium]|nr:hypothetical protein [Patescibacteria group bacterium]
MKLIYLPPWNSRIVAAFAIALLLLAALRWWRERHGLALLSLRAAAITLLVFVMLNPQSITPRKRIEKPKLAVVLDASSSMATPDAGTNSRFAAAVRTLTNSETLLALNKEFVLDLWRFDREARITSFSQIATEDPTGDASDIGKAVMSVASQLGATKSPAGILLVSDGRATAGESLSAAQLALARSVPLWTWTLGGAVPRRDLWIDTTSSEALAFSDSDVELAATLHQVGYPERSFRVEIRCDDQLIDTKDVLPDSNGVARVSVRLKAPRVGEQRYVFRVPPQPDEVDTANNERAIFLRSIGQRVRVLLAEGQPHWDSKFLVQSLKRNPNVDLTAVYRLNANRNVAVVSVTGTEARFEQDLFPRTQKDMDNYDVILLGRGADGFFDPQTEELLSQFVARRGGSLVFARGKAYGGRFQPLAKLEPVAWGLGVTAPMKLKPTDAGRDNPMFDLGSAGTLDELLERLPALDHSSVTLGEKPLAVVLATGADPDGPVLVAYQRYGQGKALTLNASGLWRWAFREKDQQESEVAYGRFWVSLLQWLLSGGQFLPGTDVALSSTKRYYSSEQPMQFLISTRNLDRNIYKPRLDISRGSETVTIEPRQRGEAFVAEAGPFAPGTYQVTLRNNVGKPAELSQSIQVVSSSVEKKELSADPDLMRQLAEVSGGAVLKEQDIAHLPEIVKRWEAARQISYRQQPVWDRWWIMAGLIALLGFEWFCRRKEGLL